MRATEGSYRENKLTGSLYDIRNIYKPLAKDDEWFTMRITVKGKHIEIRVNQVVTVDYTEPNPPPVIPDFPGRRLDHGTFALQCHDAGSKAYFRNLRVRRLPDDVAGFVSAGPAFNDYEKEIVRLGTDIPGCQLPRPPQGRPHPG